MFLVPVKWNLMRSNQTNYIFVYTSTTICKTHMQWSPSWHYVYTFTLNFRIKISSHIKPYIGSPIDGLKMEGPLYTKLER